MRASDFERLLSREALERCQAWIGEALATADDDERLDVPLSFVAQLLIHIEVLEGRLVELDGPFCRVCGCTDHNACDGGCHWVEEDLCSSCADWEDL